MTSKHDYTISLDAFQGPLDLLLFLIRRAEVDIHDIPIAPITDQYLAYLRQIDRIDIEEAGEFLVMAATLMEIKSRLLMPTVQPGDEAPADAGNTTDATDPRAGLVKQLLAYKRFRDAAAMLEGRLTEWEHRTPAAGAGVPNLSAEQIAERENESVHVDDLDLIDLVQAFGKILETIDLSRVGVHHVADDETPIEIHAADLLDRLTRDGRELPEFGSEATQSQLPCPRRGLRFAELFTGRTRAEAIGLFLAMLELIRQSKLAVRQDSAKEEIYLGLRQPSELTH
ncbi:MAG: segregation and condensation protein A [bacterium]